MERTARVTRRCWMIDHHREPGPHMWEIINPNTGDSYRRGRVVFLCLGRTR